VLENLTNVPLLDHLIYNQDVLNEDVVRQLCLAAPLSASGLAG
jgi:hypothetical protein